MIINIKRNQDIKDLGQLKYDLILKNKSKSMIGYEWKLKGEKSDESLEDFHLFCLSIVKDLLENNVKINEDIVDHSYDIEENQIDTEATLEDLECLFKIIVKQKLKNI